MSTIVRYSVLFLIFLFPYSALADDLTVKTGETVTLDAGQYEFGVVTLEKNATLNLTGAVELSCTRMDLQGGAIKYAGNLVITVGDSVADPGSLDYALHFGAVSIRPEYPVLNYGEHGRKGFHLSFIVHGNINISDYAYISAIGQEGADGQDGDVGSGMAPDQLYVPCAGTAGNDGGDGTDGTPGGDGAKGGDISIICSGAITNSTTDTLFVDASGGRGGRGGHGGKGGRGDRCNDFIFLGKSGNGGDAAEGGSGAAGGYIFIAAGEIDKVRAKVTVHGGAGGHGGLGGDGGGRQTWYNRRYWCAEGDYINGASGGHGCGDGGHGTNGSPGGDGGRVKIVSTCGIAGIANSHLKQIYFAASGGWGGNAGRPGWLYLGGHGITNTKGIPGNGGLVEVVSPTIENAIIEVEGGRGGEGSRSRIMSVGGRWGCNIPVALSGHGADGGTGGVIKAISDDIDSKSVVVSSLGGSGGLGGEGDPEVCYDVIPGNEGKTGADGSYSQVPLAPGSDTVMTALNSNKQEAGPGECFDYYVTAMASKPKSNVAIKLKVPGEMEKVASYPNTVMDFHTREVQWNISKLLECQADIFRLVTRVSDTAKTGVVTTRSELFVNGIATVQSEDFSIFVDETLSCGNACCEPGEEEITVVLQAQELLQEIEALIKLAKKKIPKKPARGSSPSKIKKWKEKKKAILQAKKDLKIIIKELTALNSTYGVEINTAIPAFSKKNVNKLVKLVNKALARKSSPRLKKVNWKKALKIVKKMK